MEFLCKTQDCNLNYFHPLDIGCEEMIILSHSYHIKHYIMISCWFKFLKKTIPSKFVVRNSMLNPILYFDTQCYFLIPLRK